MPFRLPRTFARRIHTFFSPDFRRPIVFPRATSDRSMLWFFVRSAHRPLFAGVVAGITANLIQATVPAFIGAALDSGIYDGITPHLLSICLTLIGLFVVYAAADASLMYLRTFLWVHAMFESSRLLGRQMSRVGVNLTRVSSSGEITSIIATDAGAIGNFFQRLPDLIGATLSFIVVAVLMLRTSVTVGLTVLIGMPIVVFVVSSLIRPLQRRQSVQRDAQSRLTTVTADTVAGLRILRGIGGEDVFAQHYREASQELRRTGVRVAGWQAALNSMQVLAPGLFIAAVVWLSARLAISGEISPGNLITLYGFTAFISWPLMVFSHIAQDATRALVGAGRLRRLLAITPSAGTAEERARMDLDSATRRSGDLAIPSRQLLIHEGRMTALVCSDPDISADLATRLGRFDDGDAEHPAPSVTLAGEDLRDLPMADIRASIVVNGATAELFSGTLRQSLHSRHQVIPPPTPRADLIAAQERIGELSGEVYHSTPLLPEDHSSEQDSLLLEALDAADAHDVLSSMREGLSGMISERGRSLSGGQRQRVALARALLTQAPTLVLIEPTSALDSHTEQRVAARLAQYRRERTTVVVTESPLVLHHCDEVIVLDTQGREQTRGSHRELLTRARQGDASAREYVRIVARAAGTDDRSLEQAVEVMD